MRRIGGLSISFWSEGGGLSYKKGYLVEVRLRKLLEQMGVGLVARSAGSRGLADLIAIFPIKKEVWLIQVKAWKRPPSKARLSREYGALRDLEGVYHVKAYAYVKRDGRYVLEPLGG